MSDSNVPTDASAIPDVIQKIPPKKYRLWLIILGFVLVAGGLLYAGKLRYDHDHPHRLPTISIASPITANITPKGFSPTDMTVSVGATVTWTNTDTKDHSVASNPYPLDNALDGFKSQTLTQNQTYSFIFDKAGTYFYHDDLNPSTFTGEVTVK